MTNKYLKFILTTIVVACVFCSSLTIAMAAPEETSSETETTTVVETSETTPDTSTSGGGLVIIETTTTVVTNPITTRPIVSQQQTTVQSRPNYTNNTQTTLGTTTTERVENAVADVTSTTAADTTLPNGAFYVYLELNNGQPRLKRILNEPGVVPVPNEPFRKGYLFQGWYADAEFKIPWDFSTSIADEKTVIYAKWVSDGSTEVYNIKVLDSVGGSIQVNPMTASKGEPIIITVLPDEGNRVVAGSLRINGEASDVFSFVMPQSHVVISVQFEKIPASELVDTEEKSILPFIIGAAIIIVAVIVTALVIVKRRAGFDEVEFDENGVLIIDDDDDDGWIDETLIIEDGFANGKIVRENVEPDYGDPEADEDY